MRTVLLNVLLVGAGGGEAGSTGKQLVRELGLVLGALDVLPLLVGLSLIGVVYLKVSQDLGDSLACKTSCGTLEY